MRQQPRWDRSIVALLLSVLCASAAAAAGVTALGKQVYDLTHRELDLGLLGLAEFAPAALLVLVTGSLADRLDRRRVAAAGIVGEATAALGLAWYASTDATRVAPIFLLVLCFGTARAFVAPAQRSLPSDLVPAESLPWLVARHSGTWQAAIIVGPVLAGALYVVDPIAPYLAMAALLGVSAVAMLLIPPPAPGPAAPIDAEVETPVRSGGETPALVPGFHRQNEEGAGAAAPAPPGLHDAMEGLRFIRGHPILLGAISLDLFAVLFGGAVALLPAIAEDRLHVDAVGLGWLRGAAGIGAAVVTLVLARRPLKRRVGRTLLVVVAAFGVFTIVLGVTRSFVVALVAMAALSGADAISVFIRATLVPLVTPREKRGRVLAVENVFIGASNELGAFESGVAGQVLGPTGAIVLGGAATLAIAGAWWITFPALRDVDRFPETVNPVR